MINGIQEHKENSKNIWQQLKNLGYSYRTKEEAKLTLNIDNQILCFDDYKIASYFDNFLTTVASTLASTYPKHPHCLAQILLSLRNFINKKGSLKINLVLRK